MNCCDLVLPAVIYTPQVVDPSYDLKQRSIAGVTKVKRQLENEKRTRYVKLHHSQLQRGNLKAIGRPMTTTGPGMSRCQGIVAGKSVHGLNVLGFVCHQPTSHE